MSTQLKLKMGGFNLKLYILVSLAQDSSYDLRLMSRSNKILSEPSESVNVSTIGKWLCLKSETVRYQHQFLSV